MEDQGSKTCGFQLASGNAESAETSSVAGMTERVRRAIENASVPHPRGDGERSLHYYAQVGADSFNHDPSGALIRALIETAARAGIAAMREPTEAMFDAGEDASEPSLHPTEHPDDVDNAAVVWRAMIDAALTEPRSAKP